MPHHESMQHTRTWTDVYGSPRACFEGRAGGHRWLVAAPPHLASGVPAALAAVDGKGTVDLLVHEGVTPLLGSLREGQYRGVLVVAERALASGPAVTLPQTLVEDTGGAAYAEGGEFPAWTGAGAASQDAGECVAASAAASLDVPVVVTGADGLSAALTAWMDATPHGR